MSQQRPSIIDLTRSYVLGDPNAFPANLMRTAAEDQPERTLPIVAYEGYNFLPTAYGYRSYFGMESLLDQLNAIAGKVDKLITFQLTSYVNKLIALCSDGIWMYDPGTKQWTKVQALTDNSGTDQYDEWTYCIIENALYMYRRGNGVVYKYTQAGVLSNFAPTFLNMAGQVGIFRARGRLGFWDSANSIAWSDADNLQEFTPSVEKLTGNTIFSAILGRIVAIKPQGDGFIVYCTKSIVGVSYNTTGSMIWEADSIKDSCGISTANDVTQGQTADEHYVRSNIGFLTIGARNMVSKSRKVESILPELWDLLKENNDPIKMDCLLDRYLFISTADDTYINARISQFTQEVPALVTPLIRDGSYYQGNGSDLPQVLDAGIIAALLNSLWNGPTLYRQGSRYRTPRWTVSMDYVPTAFYCDWDSSVPAGRPRWNVLTALSAAVAAVPAGPDKISTVVNLGLGYSGVTALNGTRVITGVRADSKYSDTATDPIMGKVWCDSLHYTQETIWDNVKERNKAIFDIIRGVADQVEEEIYENTNPDPETPLDNTEEVLGFLPDGYGPIRQVQNVDGTEIILRKHFQSGWELVQQFAQTDDVVEIAGGGGGGGGADPLDRVLEVINTPVVEGGSDYPLLIAVEGNKMMIQWYKDSTYTVTHYYSLDAGVTWNNSPAVADPNSVWVIGTDFFGLVFTTTGWILYGDLGILVCSDNANIPVKKTLFADIGYYPRDTSYSRAVKTDIDYRIIYWGNIGSGNGYVYASANGITWAQEVNADASTNPANYGIVRCLGQMHFANNKVYIFNIRRYGGVDYLSVGSTADKTLLSGWVFQDLISHITPVHIPGLMQVSWISSENKFYILLLGSSSTFFSVYTYNPTTDEFLLQEMCTDAAAAGWTTWRMDFINNSFSSMVKNGDRLRLLNSYEDDPSVGSGIRLFQANPIAVQAYQHTRTTTRHFTWNALSNGAGGISELKFTKTHIDYCMQKRNGDIVVEKSVAVSAPAIPAWDGQYPAGIENAKDVWLVDDSIGPNPIDLYRQLYAGIIQSGKYQSSIDSLNPGYTYFEDFTVGNWVEATYPSVSYVLQDGTPAPLYPTYKGAFVYDLHLKKWGKFKGDHQFIVNLSPVNNAEGGVISYTNFGMEAGVLLADNTIALFDAQPADSFLRWGKIGYYRLGITRAHEVRIHFRSEPNCKMVVDSSMDGRTIDTTLSKEFILQDETVFVENPDVNGRWFSISLHGAFDLQFLELRGTIGGRR